jgi:hypothetical protein
VKRCREDAVWSAALDRLDRDTRSSHGKPPMYAACMKMLSKGWTSKQRAAPSFIPTKRACLSGQGVLSVALALIPPIRLHVFVRNRTRAHAAVYFLVGRLSSRGLFSQ